MELDDLKGTWDSQSDKAQEQNVTSRLIDNIARTKYNSKINRIAYPEIFGSAICLITTLFIGFNFHKLDTTFLQGVGIIAILVLLALSLISYLSVRQLKLSKEFNKPYVEVLKILANQKFEFYKLQKINITLSYILLVAIIILLAKYFGGKDITNSKYFWTFSFSFGYIFLLIFSKYVSKYYQRTIKQSEDLLRELQS